VTVPTTQAADELVCAEPAAVPAPVESVPRSPNPFLGSNQSVGRALSSGADDVAPDTRFGSDPRTRFGRGRRNPKAPKAPARTPKPASAAEPTPVGAQVTVHGPVTVKTAPLDDHWPHRAGRMALHFVQGELVWMAEATFLHGELVMNDPFAVHRLDVPPFDIVEEPEVTRADTQQALTTLMSAAKQATKILTDQPVPFRHDPALAGRRYVELVTTALPALHLPAGSSPTDGIFADEELERLAGQATELLFARARKGDVWVTLAQLDKLLGFGRADPHLPPDPDLVKVVNMLVARGQLVPPPSQGEITPDARYRVILTKAP